MKKEIYVPQANRVVVVMERQQEKTEGGIVVTESKAHTSFHKGQVKLIGDTVTRMKVGDTISVGAGKGIPLIIDKVECSMFFEDEIDFVISLEEK